MSRTVPFLDLGPSRSAVKDELDRAWATVTAHGQFVGGEEVEAFEAAFAEYCDAARCVGVGNGTDALELVLLGLGLSPGAEVIVPTNTFVATAEAVVHAGMIPRFVDVDPDTLLIDPGAVRAAIGPRTEAIIAVHLFGQPCDLPALLALAERHDLALIEDAAQAHGAALAGARIGAHGHAATFSFYPGKNLGAFGDGGAITTDDGALADQVALLAAHGRDPDDRQIHRLVGRNSRLDTLMAAILHVRLERLEHENGHRRRVDGWYRELLPPTARPVRLREEATSAHHLFVVQVQQRERVMASLAQAGVGTGIHYRVPCHRQPAFAHLDPVALPVAEAAAGRIVSLPMGPHLDREDVAHVCDELAAALVDSAA